MLEILISIFGSGAAIVMALWVSVKFLLPVATEFFVKRMEHMQNLELKRFEHIQNLEINQLEARLQAHTTSLTTSMDIASRIGDSSRVKTIESIELLWNEILHIQRCFAPLVAIVSIVKKEEYIKAIKNPALSKGPVGEALTELASDGKIERIISGHGESADLARDLAVMVGVYPGNSDKARPFVSEVAYGQYRLLKFIPGRLAYLLRSGIESGEPIHWADDPNMVKMISTACTITGSKELKKITESEMPNFRMLVQELNRQFIIEAKKCVRGTDDLAESASEVSQIYQTEEARNRFARGFS